MGLTTFSKASLGLKVVGGASKGTLKSSVYYKAIYGSEQISLFGGRITKLPTITGVSTTYWSSFFGRNTAVLGTGRVGIGGTIIYSDKK